MTRAAVFLDRDGTVIELVHHLNSAADVRLISGAASAIGRLNRAGVLVIVVTNQSVIGRGKLTEGGLMEIHAQVSRLLAAEGARIDAYYHCPVAPTVKDPRQIEHPDRKPGPGMLLRAAEHMGLDLGQSLMVGDTISDMLAGRNAGVGATVLVRTGYGSRVALPDPAIDLVLESLAELTETDPACLVPAAGASNRTDPCR